MIYFLRTIFLLIFSTCIYGQNYKAGVVLYKTDEEPLSTPDEKVQKNLITYTELVMKMKGQVDILVFPEFGVSTIQAKMKQKEHLNDFSIKNIGKVNDLLCAHNSTREGKYLANLACAAINSKMYVILNLLEKEEEKFYVTTIGIDNLGNLILKCRKSHLTAGTHFEFSENAANCTFTAKFPRGGNAPGGNSLLSVPFTIFFETDLIYGFPWDSYNENVIVTSAVRNIMPLDVGFSLYQGFSAGNSANLLVSGYFDANNQYGGSGIYWADGNSLTAFQPENFTGGAAPAHSVLIGELPVKPASTPILKVQTKLVGNLPEKNVNLQYFDIPVLNETQKEFEKCLDPKKCCKFKADLDQNDILPYKWIMLSNKTKILDQETEILLCAILSPSSHAAPLHFRNLSITSNLEKSKSNQTIPLALQSIFAPANFTFARDLNEISLWDSHEMVLFGLLHTLNADVPEPAQNVALIVVVALLCCALVALFVYFVWRRRQQRGKRRVI